MKPTVIVRKNRLFSIDEKVLPKSANTLEIKNGLYEAIYREFRGAAFSDSYKALTPLQRMEQLNEFAWTWLSDRGHR